MSSTEDPMRRRMPSIDERDLFPRAPPLIPPPEAPGGDEGVPDELELGLSLGGAARQRQGSRRDGEDECKRAGAANATSNGWLERCRILTAMDFPATGYTQQHHVDMRPAGPPLPSPAVSTSSVSSSASSHADGCRTPKVAAAVGGVGTKRAADQAAQEPRSNSTSPVVVGWPPIRAYRVNTLVNQPRDTSSKQSPSTAQYGINTTGQAAEDHHGEQENRIIAAEKEPGKKKNTAHLVKVNMDGMAIGRKVDLCIHRSYNGLALALEDMFQNNPNHCQTNKSSKLLEGASDFVLTYQDKDGDWMLVGDVPWGMFFNSARRLRIMRKCDANDLAPGFQPNIDGMQSMHG